jgi:N-acetylglucosaminyldiphosphoundecaprenol N-acetyl-beta-D-mannosaminyltransferase
LCEAAGDRELREILDGCSVALAEGMSRAWTSRWVGRPLKHRVAASDLFPRLLETFARKRWRIFLMGATEERTLWARDCIRREYPEAEVCGCAAAPGPLETMASDAMLRLIEAAKPDVLMVALGNTRQEKWLAMHRHRLSVPVCVGVGASAGFFPGMQSRTPAWMQRSGMERLSRFFSEPRHSRPRSLDCALFLLRHLSMQLFVTSVQPSKMAAREVSATPGGRARGLSYRRNEQE